MLLPMSPTDSLFLTNENRERPMHVAGLQLFRPPDGADAAEVRRIFEAAVRSADVSPLFRRRPRRSLTTLGQWGWEIDADFDIDHHVRISALPQPGRVLELLALCSRLHSTLLDRHRPLWEAHLIEGLADGRFALYFKVHHALVDGMSAMKLLVRSLSEDADEREMDVPWATHSHPSRVGRGAAATALATFQATAGGVADAAGLVPALAKTVNRALKAEAASMSFSAPRSMLNVPITGSRRFAAQSWPLSRIRQVGKTCGMTVNDVVLGMCAGALRAYLLELGELPDSPLIAAVPVSLRSPSSTDTGNAVGMVMVSLGTDLADPAERLKAIQDSMTKGKESMQGLSQLQILALSGLGISPLAVLPMLGLNGKVRPPFNLIISNVPGPRRQLYWNGAALDGLYPLSIPFDGQALNITVTSYSDNVAFGLTGCRRSVPHMQRLLIHLDAELSALEVATAVA